MREEAYPATKPGPGKFSPVAGYARRGGLPRAQTDETERPTRRYMQVELYGSDLDGGDKIWEQFVLHVVNRLSQCLVRGYLAYLE